MPAATKAPAKKAAVKRAARQVPQLPFDQKLVLQQWVFKLLEARDIYGLCDEEFRHPDAEAWDTENVKTARKIMKPNPASSILGAKGNHKRPTILKGVPNLPPGMSAYQAPAGVRATNKLLIKGEEEPRPFTPGPLESLSEDGDTVILGRTEDEDIFAPLREAGGVLDEAAVHRILVAVAAEARCIAKHVRRAETTLLIEDYGEELALASQKLDGVIRCVEGLVVRMRDLETGRRGDGENEAAQCSGHGMGGAA